MVIVKFIGKTRFSRSTKEHDQTKTSVVREILHVCASVVNSVCDINNVKRFTTRNVNDVRNYQSVTSKAEL